MKKDKQWTIARVGGNTAGRNTFVALPPDSVTGIYKYSN